VTRITRVTDLPELPADATLMQVVAFLQALRVQNLAREPSSVGEGLDKFVTRRELNVVGLLNYSRVGGVVSIGNGPDGTGIGSGAGGAALDLSPPTQISGLIVTGLLTHFFVEFSAPTYPQGGGNAYTEVYAANYAGTGPLPTFPDAVLVYEVTGAATVAIIPAQPGQETHFWVGAVTVGGVRQVDGLGPTGGVNGVTATTGADVSSLLAVLTGQITESQLFSTLGARIDLVDASASVAGSVNARVSSEASTRQTNDTALSNSISTVSASIGPAISAAVSTEATARATVDGGLLAQWTVKLDVNGYVSGFGLASTGGAAAPTSSFVVRADSFSISSPSGPGVAPITPFIVRTSAGTVNGVAYPAGVYMDSAYILDLTAAIARLGTAWIDDAKIANLSAGKLTAGSIAVGEYLQSTSFVAGSAGWRISGNGSAEFAASVIRGTLVASQIGAGQIDASKINVSSLSAITATIGTLRTATTGGRTEIADNVIRVYDTSNVLRVKIGYLL
jgi:hypothetical protein